MSGLATLGIGRETTSQLAGVTPTSLSSSPRLMQPGPPGRTARRSPIETDGACGEVKVSRFFVKTDTFVIITL